MTREWVPVTEVAAPGPCCFSLLLASQVCLSEHLAIVIQLSSYISTLRFSNSDGKVLYFQFQRIWGNGSQMTVGCYGFKVAATDQLVLLTAYYGVPS